MVRDTRVEKEMEKNTHSNFFVLSSLLDYVRQGFKETFDITYDEYEQKELWKLKENASGVFKIRLSNVLARSLGFNMSLPFTKSPISAKVDRHWEKTACAESNHPKHYTEIAFSSSQQLVSNETPEDHYIPSFFHIQCNIASPVLINDKFLNSLATIQLTENERYKYLCHYVPKHILYIPVRVASFREIHFRFTNQLNQTLMFSDSSSVTVLHICSCYNVCCKISILSNCSFKKLITTASGSCYSFEWRMGNVHNPIMYTKASNYSL